MTIAWFRATQPPAARSLDETAGAIHHIGAAHTLRVITSTEADDFVWHDHHAPATLYVFELSDEPDAAFVWPYLFRFPGLLILSGASLHNSRASMLQQQARYDDYRAEFLFNEGHPPPDRHKVLPRGSWPMLRAAVTASKVTVVRHEAVAERLREQFPDARIICVPLGCDEARSIGGGGSQAGRRTEERPLRCVVYGQGRIAAAEDAAKRASTSRPIQVRAAEDGSPLCDADVILAMSWPRHGESLMPALAGMAASRPVVVFETEATAGWPAVDPQTWQRRDRFGSAPPVAISIDPRDEEHSLMLALRRLDSDADFARTLADAGHAWWASHATTRQSLAAWDHAIAEAASLPIPTKPAGWPAHLAADGLGQAREILEAFGVEVDFVREANRDHL